MSVEKYQAITKTAKEVRMSEVRQSYRVSNSPQSKRPEPKNLRQMTAVELQAEIDRLDAQIKRWAIILEELLNANRRERQE